MRRRSRLKAWLFDAAGNVYGGEILIGAYNGGKKEAEEIPEVVRRQTLQRTERLSSS